MADKSYDELINESFALINKAANTTDAITKKKLIDQAKTLKVQAEAIPLSVRKTQKETKARAEAATTGKQNYDAAQKELKRLRALPSTTPGLAASINVAESKVNKFKQCATVTFATGSKPPIAKTTSTPIAEDDSTVFATGSKPPIVTPTAVFTV